MKAALFEKFGAHLKITTVQDPKPDEDGAVLKVKASGICRSDWHGWMGHDPDITKLPHVPGHELAGIVEETGSNIKNWKKGDKVTIPFVAGCGSCPECQSGNHQICDNQYQPGFSGWGSFAEYVAIKYADINLVRLPEQIDFITAASLGCRFSTSYRAVKAQGNVQTGQWIAVHGCGGVGLSAIMISIALGARVIGIDINEDSLKLAHSLGAEAVINAANNNVVELVYDITGRGAHVSIDALGSIETCANSILCLRKGGRHVQVGLMAGSDYMPALPMHKVISNELQIYGSHGMQAYKYGEMFKLILSGKMNPRQLINKTISLEQVPQELADMNEFKNPGITVITEF